MAGQIRPIKEELWGIDFGSGAYKVPEETPVTDAGGDWERLEYGRLHRKKGFLARLFLQKKDSGSGRTEEQNRAPRS